MKRLLLSATVGLVLFSGTNLFAGDSVSSPASSPLTRSGSETSSSESDALNALIASRLEELAGALVSLAMVAELLAEHQQSKPEYPEFDGNAKQYQDAMEAWSEQMALLEDHLKEAQNNVKKLENEIDALMDLAAGSKQKDAKPSLDVASSDSRDQPLFTILDEMVLFSLIEESNEDSRKDSDDSRAEDDDDEALAIEFGFKLR